jgi:hypothetical protein
MDYAALKKVLNRNEFAMYYFGNRDEATGYLNGEVDNTIVGLGDSATLLEMSLYDSLKTHNIVYDPAHPVAGMTFSEMAMKCFGTNVFITSVNAIAETGELVNIDGTGNRVAASLVSHERVYFVLGVNKIEPTLEKAIWRARNIAAPLNAKRLQKGTPCSIKGDRCYNCAHPGRICNCLVVYWNAMNSAKDSMKCAYMEVVLIGEKLGL